MRTTLAVLALTMTVVSAVAQSAERSAVYRHTVLVSDLERSLKLYRDVLGLVPGRVSSIADDAYANVFFNIPVGSMRRFAYLDGADGQPGVLGLGEVHGVTLPAPVGPRLVAWVQPVADPEAVLQAAKALGLEIVPPLTRVDPESGRTHIQAGIVDFDGHLVMVYGKRPLHRGTR